MLPILFPYVFALGWEDFDSEHIAVFSYVPGKGRVSWLKHSTEDWSQRPCAGLALAQIWGKWFSLSMTQCLQKRKKKKRSLLSVLNMFSDPLCSTKVLFLWKHFSKQQRQWGGFLYIWKLIQIFLRCSKPFCNMCYLGQNFRFCQGKIFFWLWKMQVTGEEWRTEN